MNAEELIAERAKLLARLEEINKMLQMLEMGEPVHIRTHKSIRWCGYRDQVYADSGLTKLQDTSVHWGWVSAATFAAMQNRGDAHGKYPSIWKAAPDAHLI